MSGYTYKIGSYQNIENFDVYLLKKSISHLSSFWSYYKDFANLLHLGTLDMTGHTHKNW